MNRYEIEIGKKYGYLTVLEYIGVKENGKCKNPYYLCKCDCGNITEVRKDHLYYLDIVSCGCMRGKLDLGQDNTRARLITTFRNMKRRCYNPKSHKYKNYGQRGIKICDEWLNDFNKFYEWALENGYRTDLTIDRINNDGDYEPNNVRFINNKKQSNNRTNNCILKINGISKTFSEWCDFYNVNYKIAHQRYKRGSSIEDIFYKGNLKKKHKEDKA